MTRPHKTSLEIHRGDFPIVATAIHNGHELPESVRQRLLLSDTERLREEDPYTGAWTAVVPNRVIAHHSRFEIDLNRSRDKAVYLEPDQAWGLHVWRSRPDTTLVEESLQGYDEFYQRMYRLLKDLERRHGAFVVLDLHTYNHRRQGPEGPPADAEQYPQINVGTGTMDRALWAPLVDRFMDDLRAYDFPTGGLDVRENVCFQGGYFPGWVHRLFSKTGCALAVEVKKFFMDEWSGEFDENLHAAVGDALRSTVPGIIEELKTSVARRLHSHCA